MKHKLSLYLVTVLMSMVCIGASAYDFEKDGIYYNITEGTNVSVTYDFSNPYSGVVTIPSSFKYNSKTYYVTSIGNMAFVSCTELTSVTIGSKVSTIGDLAFGDCTGLTTVTIPNSVTSIGNTAFGGCTGLVSVTFGTGLKTIGDNAFYRCSSLLSISIPSKVTSIGKQVFRDCTNLNSVTIGSSVTTIDDAAFFHCSNLTSVTIPKSVTSLGYNIFAGCNNLETIVVASGNTKYDSRNSCNAVIEKSSNTLLAGCKNTVIPNTVTAIGVLAFSDCSSLTSITIPNSVTTIGGDAFSDCTGLTSITIPSNVTSIGSGAFEGCSNLTAVTVERSAPVSISSNTFSNRANAILYVPSGSSKETYKAADYWKEFKKILVVGECEQSLAYTAIPSMTYGDEAYALPEQTTQGLTLTWSVEDGTIANISGNILTILKAGTTTVTASQEGDEDYDTFEREFTLTISKAPLTITANDCTKHVGDDNPELTVSYEGFKYNDDATSLTTQPIVSTTATKDSPVGTYPITASGAASDNYNFTYFGGTMTVTEKLMQTLELTEIPAMTYGDAAYTLPPTTSEGLTLTWSIEDATIANISGNILTIQKAGATTVTATQAGNNDYAAFEREFTLTVGKAMLTITANDCTKRAGDDNPELTVSYEGFKYNDDATSLATQPIVSTTAAKDSPVGTYPITVSGATSDNYNFTYVEGTLTVTAKPVSPIIIFADESVKSICVAHWDTNHDGELSEEEAAAVTDLDGNFEETAITSFDELKYFTGLTSIGKTEFSDCSNLTSVSIPSSVTSYGKLSFDCENLISVTVGKEEPVSIYENTFSNRRNATLYVPEGCVPAYRTADYWKDFGVIEEIVIPVETEDVAISDAGIRTYCSEYDLDFTDVAGLKAYIASGFDPSTGDLLLTRVEKVPAGVGLVLKGAQGEYDIPHTEADMHFANLLIGVLTPTIISPTEGGYTNYILSGSGIHGIGFYTLSEAGEIGANKAYLQVPTKQADARVIRLVFDDEDNYGNVENGIEIISEAPVSAPIFDLQGHRVQQPRRGLYIVNGKKIFIK